MKDFLARSDKVVWQIKRTHTERIIAGMALLPAAEADGGAT